MTIRRTIAAILLLCLTLATCTGCIASSARVVVKTVRDGVDYRIEYELSN